METRAAADPPLAALDGSGKGVLVIRYSIWDCNSLQGTTDLDGHVASGAFIHIFDIHGR